MSLREGAVVDAVDEEMTGRYRQLIRCLRLVRDKSYLHSRDTEWLQILARRHHVSTRTMRRDLQALREAGYGFTTEDYPKDRPA